MLETVFLFFVVGVEGDGFPTYSVNVDAKGSLDHGINGKSDINVSLDVKTSRDSSLDLSSDVEIDAEVGVLGGKRNVSHSPYNNKKRSRLWKHSIPSLLQW